MFDNKLFSILKNLSAKEIKLLREFLTSPFFNKSEKCIKLFDRIISEHPDFRFANLTKEDLHYEIFPKIKYNDATMRHLFSDLLSLVEKYLVQLNLNDKTFDKNSMLLEALYERNIHELIYKYLIKYEDLVMKEKQIGSDFLLNRFKLFTDKFNCLSMDPKSFSSKNINNTIKILDERNKCLISFSIIEIIKSFDTLNLISKKYNVNPEKFFSSKMISFLDFNDTLNFLMKQTDSDDSYIVLSLYQKLFFLLSDFENESNYFHFKSEFYKNINNCNEEAKGYFFKKLIDYCILKNKSEKKVNEFEYELFTVYCDILNQNLVLNPQTKTFPLDLFRNIVFLALKIKKLNWVENFILNYSKYLPPAERKNLVNFSYASLYFEKGEFEKALLISNKIDLNSYSMKIDVKNLMVKVYFELGHSESALSLINSYREFLKNSSFISTERRLHHKEFIKYTEQMLLLKNSFDKTKAQLLYQDISKHGYLLNKRWLLAKLKELIQ